MNARNDLKLKQAENLWQKGFDEYVEKNYSGAINLFDKTLDYFSLYKKAYLYKAYCYKKIGHLEAVVKNLETYIKLEKIYPEEVPELELKEAEKLKNSLIKKLEKTK